MAKLGFTLLDNDGNQVSLYPSQQVNVTQGYGGSYSHVGTLNLDNASTSTLRKIAAPFDCIVASNQSSAGYGIVIFHSVKPVLTPSGLKNVSLVLMHDNNAYRWAVGNTYSQGEHIYDEGDADPSGITTGIHVHMEASLTLTTIRVRDNDESRYHIENQSKIEDVFYINGADYINEIPLSWTNSQRPYLTSYVPIIPPDPDPEPEPSGDDDIIPLYAMKLIRGLFP